MSCGSARNCRESCAGSLSDSPCLCDRFATCRALDAHTVHVSSDDVPLRCDSPWRARSHRHVRVGQSSGAITLQQLAGNGGTLYGIGVHEEARPVSGCFGGGGCRVHVGLVRQGSERRRQISRAPRHHCDSPRMVVYKLGSIIAFVANRVGIPSRHVPVDKNKEIGGPAD